MSGTSRDEKRRHWRVVVAEWEASGLTGADFCRERGIAPHRWGYWRRRLKEEDAPELSGFARVEEASGCSGVRLRWREDVVVEVESGFDEATLARVLRVVSGC